MILPGHIIEKINGLKDTHNQKRENSHRRVTMVTLQEVFERGVKAYEQLNEPVSRNLSPEKKYNAGLARVKAFLYKAEKGSSYNGLYSHDNDLLDFNGISHEQFADGGELNSLNPTGGVFVDYTSENRDLLPLGKNITTYDKTAGLKPEHPVIVYRAVPSTVTKIVSGDFVTTNRQLATDYAGTDRVLSMTVRADEILDDFTEPLGEEYILRLRKHSIQNKPDIKFAEGGEILLAPNGKPSNLTPEQWHLVRTPEFKAWFGDWENSPETASKVVDENGEPLVVFHGTCALFNVFNESEKGKRGGLNEKYWSFTTNIQQALIYALDCRKHGRFGEPRIIACFLNIREMPTYDNDGKYYRDLQVWAGYKWIDIFQLQDFHSRGFDMGVEFKEVEGFCVKNTIEMEKINDYKDAENSLVGNTYYVINSTQIKLADGSNTTFDSENPDIRFKSGGYMRLSKTPAPKKERIYGSETNPEGSSSSGKAAKEITFSESTLKSIRNKIDEHNANHPKKKVTLEVAKAVVRRGMGAYSSTHRPTIKGGRPNSRTAWGLARLNAFLYKAVNGKSKSGRYSEDNDLLDELEIKHQKFAEGGSMDKNQSILDFITQKVNGKIIDSDTLITKEEYPGLQERMNIGYGWKGSLIMADDTLVGIKIDERKRVIVLSKIISEKKGSGIGTKVIRAIIDYSIITGKELWIEDVVNKKYFEKFGNLEFVSNEGGKKTYALNIKDEFSEGGSMEVGGIFHGSPHRFDKFSTQYMGTGEGAQAFGWGLYFTDIESIARSYAKPSIDNEFVINGVDLRGKIPYNLLIDLNTLIEFKNKPELLSDGFEEETINKLREYAVRSNDIELYKNFRWIDDFNDLKFKRNLYKVTLHKGKTPDQYTWLEWDKPITDQNAKNINSQFEKEGLEKTITDEGKTKTASLLGINKSYNYYRPNPISGTGKTFYESLVSYFLNLGVNNPQKEASLFLLRAGIDGIKYPAESISRGATSDTARGFNYVVFDENAVTIEDVEQFAKGGAFTPPYPINKAGGYDYSGKAAKKAEEFDLLTLPRDVNGTHCGNCFFFEKGMCLHKKIMLPVTDRMCCAVWDNADSERSYEKKLEKGDAPENTEKFPVNDRGGYDYNGKALETAEKFDLITLPKKIEGTNCANCGWFSPYKDGGYCFRPNILLPVTGRMSCKLWNSLSVKRDWSIFDEGGEIGNEPKLNTYQQRINANFKAMDSSSEEWTAVPIRGFKVIDKNGKDISMPEFDFPKGYTKAPGIFPSTEQDNMNCELCGKTPIKTAYYIQNDKKKWTLMVGSECVTHFGEGTSGKQNLRQFKVNMADILKQDLDSAYSYIRDKFSRMRTEYTFRGKREYRDWSTTGLTKTFSEYAKGDLVKLDESGVLDILKNPKRPHQKDLINWNYVAEAIPFFDDSYERKNGLEEKRQQLLLSWFTKNETKAASFLVAIRSIAKELNGDEIVFNYLESKEKEGDSVSESASEKKDIPSPDLSVEKMEGRKRLDNMFAELLMMLRETEVNSALADVESTAKALENDKYIAYLSSDSLNDYKNMSLKSESFEDFLSNFRESINDYAWEYNNPIFDSYRTFVNQEIGEGLMGDLFSIERKIDNVLKSEGMDISGKSMLEKMTIVYGKDVAYNFGKYGMKSPISVLKDFYYANQKNVSDAYHKAKADDSNPELVRAVEELLSQKLTKSATENEPEKHGFTEGADLKAINEKLKKKYGEKEAAKLYQVALRLVNPNRNTIVEIRSSGVVINEGGKYIFLPFGNTDANSKNWILYKGMDVTDQFDKKDEKTEPAKPEPNPIMPDNQHELLQYVSSLLESGTATNIVNITSKAKQLNILDANKNPDRTKVKEITELAVCIVGRKLAHENKSLDDRYDNIVKLYNNQANLSFRTSESQMLQQYSTPVPIAFLAGVFCGFEKPGNYFEPSAGNGLLTVAGNPQDFTVNEIDWLRRRNLEYQGFKKVLEMNAENPFPEFKGVFDAAITNPPFGSIRGEKFVARGMPITKLEHMMAIHALDTVKNDGRCAIIIGGHTPYDSKGRILSGSNRNFYVYLAHFYNLIDSINISGKMYSRQGTSYDVRLLLIDGKKSKPGGFPPLADASAGSSEIWSLKPVMNYDEFFERMLNHI